MRWFSRWWRPKNKTTADSFPPAREGEVRPPWIEFPGIAPGDFFWREAGEPFLASIWEPFYNRLTPEQQAAYLAYWQVPKEWHDFYFRREWREFWDHIDDPE